MQSKFIGFKAGERDSTRSVETACRHALEKRDKMLHEVQLLEMKHEITLRWTEGTAEWSNAADLSAMQQYQQALDRLEGLVVSRLFELTKVNMSHTGALLQTSLAMTDL